jgi:hypothetical protein
MDHESHTSSFSILNNSSARLQCRGNRLLANDINSALRGVTAYLFVSLWGRDDVNEIRLFDLDHALPIAVVMGKGKFGGHILGLFLGTAANRGDLYVWDPRPRFILKWSKVASPNSYSS